MRFKMYYSNISPSGWFLIRVNKATFMNKTAVYIKEVIEESKKVTWPSRNQTLFFTVAVLIVSVGIAYYLNLFDSLFARGLEWLLNR